MQDIIFICIKIFSLTSCVGIFQYSKMINYHPDHHKNIIARAKRPCATKKNRFGTSISTVAAYYCIYKNYEIHYTNDNLLIELLSYKVRLIYIFLLQLYRFNSQKI